MRSSPSLLSFFKMLGVKRTFILRCHPSFTPMFSPFSLTTPSPSLLNGGVSVGGGTGVSGVAKTSIARGSTAAKKVRHANMTATTGFFLRSHQLIECSVPVAGKGPKRSASDLASSNNCPQPGLWQCISPALLGAPQVLHTILLIDASKLFILC